MHLDLVLSLISVHFCRVFSATKLTSGTLPRLHRIGLHLEKLSLVGCKIRSLPESLFLFLLQVKYVDVRQNFLVSLPSSVAYHPTLEVFLLSENLFTEVPAILSTLPRLTVHGLSHKTHLRKQACIEESENLNWVII